MLTLQQLQSVYREAPLKRLEPFLEPINCVLQKYNLNTLERQRMFLAQIGHESGQLRYTEELASGTAYEGRTNLGNTQPGDGVKYKGRGLIQITGRTNYALCGLALDLPLLENPEVLVQLPHSVESAAWYWNTNNLNSYCDALDFLGLSYRINGKKKAVNGVVPNPNGWEDRVLLYKRAIEALT